MSELKAFNSERIYWAVEQVERVAGDIDTLHLDDSQFYLKSEADKVIADLEESHKKEIGQLLMEIVEQKSEIERLEILCANYRHDCDNLAISNEQVKRAASTLLKKMNHNKRKRCLAMAKLCHWKMGVFIYKEEKSNFYHRWHKRWLAIAEKFKTNSTVQ